MQASSERRCRIGGAGASITPAGSVTQATPEVDDETERHRPTRVHDDAPRSRDGRDPVAAENEPTAAASVAVANDTACEGGRQ